jgi:O-antigen/teichoic acid export membrane protein
MEFALRSLRLLGFRVLTVVAMLAITVVTARWLGPEGRGVYTLVLLYSQIGVTLLGGAGSALAYQISNQGRPAREVVTVAVTLAAGVGALALIVTVAIVAASGQADLWWLAIAGAAQIPLLVGAALTWGFLGSDDHAAYNRAIIAPSLLTLLALCVLLGPEYLVQGEGSARTALIAWLLGQSAVVLWLLWLGRRAWLPPDWRAITPAALLSLVTFGLQTGIADFISFLNYRVDVFLLEVLRGTEEVGVYSVAVQSAEALWFISSAVSVVIYARVGSLPRAEAAALAARAMRHSVFIIAVLGGGLALVSGVAMPLLFGAAYDAADDAFRLLLPGIVVFGLGRIFSTFFTNALGRPRVPLAIAATSLGISLPLCLLLIPRLGMNGSAIATSVSYIVSIGIAAWLFSRETGIPLRRTFLLDGDDLDDYRRVAGRVRSLLRGGRQAPSEGGP